MSEEIDRNKECLEKISDLLQTNKPRKAFVQTYEEYNYRYENRQYLQIENIINLLCEKNIITREELEDRMKKDYEENILPNLQHQVDEYNKICGFDKE